MCYCCEIVDGVYNRCCNSRLQKNVGRLAFKLAEYSLFSPYFNVYIFINPCNVYIFMSSCQSKVSYVALS